MSAARGWTEANQAHLVAAVAEVRRHLERYAAGEAPADGAERADAAAAPDGRPPALEAVGGAFGLSPFERGVLLLAAGMELDAAFAPLCAAAHGDAARPHPTWGLALAALPGAHWSALTPAGPLRDWRLVEVLAGDTLATAPLRIDEWVLHLLAGAPHLDQRLRPLIRPVADAPPVTPSQERVAARIAERWAAGGTARGAVRVGGPDAGSRRGVAACVADALGLALHLCHAGDLPTAPAEREMVARLWEREAVLRGALLAVDLGDAEPPALRAAAALLEAVDAPVLVLGDAALPATDLVVERVEVPRPTAGERVALWRDALGPAAASLNGAVEEVVEQFPLGAAAIRAAAGRARADLAERAGHEGAADPGRVLRDACRAQARPRLDDLAQRLDPAAGWDDLVLPAPQREVLRQIAAAVAQRARVHEAWGFAARGRRGLGIGALFAGASGTGKTMAAEVLAAELGLDLFRVDLSQVVSKFIGETEKNLARVFDAAEEGGVVLLFDEADALFGKRSEVKDSHDRYANIEVSYLLQRMEAYRGLAILTTNLRGALDPAFLRRIRFVVQFPFPDAAQRAEIWRRVFPAAVPLDGVDPARLARLSVAGGNIRNIALNAAVLAADAGHPVGMEHLLRAAQGEYAKLERPLTDAEVAGWR